ncbi:hypothetical protein STTU_1199 [Streptomyces sp. Tu6071]|nr:hypothetical protein STTU_1199 [Streptomyces sp. Tu6071]
MGTRGRMNRTRERAGRKPGDGMDGTGRTRARAWTGRAGAARGHGRVGAG